MKNPLAPDPRYVYLLKRTKGNQATPVYSRKMLNARKAESKLLKEIFSDSRFTMAKRIKPGKWLQGHYKIGIAKNRLQRWANINENIFKSGRTEWVALNPLEVLVCQGWIFYLSIRPYLIATALLALLGAFVYLSKFHQ